MTTSILPRPTRRIRLAQAVAALSLLGMTVDRALADTSCSGPGQPPCSCGFLCFDCDYLYLVHLNQCSDADGWPARCGGEGEPPCTIVEHVPSCKSGLAEIPFPGGNCTRLDSDGFPTFCGGVGERACVSNEHIPSCKGGLIEERGVCRAIDQEGFPTSCGGDGEPGCDAIVQTILGITSCKRCHVEIPAVAGTCRLVKEDRYPAVCGGCGQSACDISTQAQIFEPACKPGLTEEGGVCKRLDSGGNPIGCANLGEPGLATTVTPPARPRATSPIP
jgi:hypothetical protein